MMEVCGCREGKEWKYGSQEVPELRYSTSLAPCAAPIELLPPGLCENSSVTPKLLQALPFSQAPLSFSITNLTLPFKGLDLPS